MEALNTEVTQAEQHVKEVDERNRSLRSKKKELNGELEGLRAQIDASQKECRQLLKEQEVSREDEAELVGNRYKRLTPCSHGALVLQERLPLCLFTHIVVFPPPEESWR